MRFRSKVASEAREFSEIGSLSQRFAHDESHYYARAGPGGAEKISQASRAAHPNWVAKTAPETVVAERAVAGMDARRRKPSTATKVYTSWIRHLLSARMNRAFRASAADMALSCRCGVIVAADSDAAPSNFQ